MTFDRRHLKISFISRISGTDEIGETTLRMADAGSTSPTPPNDCFTLVDNTCMAALSTAYINMVTLTNLWRASYSGLALIKVAEVDTTGKYAKDGEGNKLVKSLVITGDAGSNSNVIPQATTAVTLRTASLNPRRAFRGRMYLPHTMCAPGSGQPRSSSTVAQGLADNARTFLLALNALSPFADKDLVACVMSKVGTGSCQAVTSAYVGDVVDTQQRRRAQLAETYYHHDL